ncbi:MAG TPA: pepsin-like aspartyl protease, partial [Kofleriaceae bacterium]
APAFTPLNQQIPYYIVGVGSAAVGTAASLTSADFGPTIIDTGTTLTYVPKAVVTAVAAGISASANYHTVFGTQTLADGACLDSTMTAAQIDAALPPLSLTFAGGTAPISLPATRSYLIAQGHGSWCFTFSDSSTLFQGQKVSLFGNTLLGGMITIFDVANKQIGFALQTGCAEQTNARTLVVRRPSFTGGAVISQPLE